MVHNDEVQPISSCEGATIFDIQFERMRSAMVIMLLFLIGLIKRFKVYLEPYMRNKSGFCSHQGDQMDLTEHAQDIKQKKNPS